MNKLNKEIQAQDIIKSISRSITNSEKEKIEKACLYAKEKHSGQKRYSGEPYHTHVFEVGKLIASFNMSTNVIVAGILHDTIEDTDTTAKDIEKEFGKEVAFFVESVSHLGEVRYAGLDLRVKSLQKLFVATSKDLRVVIIKLMDRLHNMRTLSAVPKEKQKRIAKETQRVYAPIADRLGMGSIKTELDEIAFKHLNPKMYSTISEKIEEVVGSTNIKEIEKEIKKKLSSSGIVNVTLSSRIKGAYSTHMKMQFKKYVFEQINDLIAIRVLVDDIPSAYNALGIIHSTYSSIPGTFKDYISLPKPNGYRALHTRVIVDKKIIEIHLLTYDMYQHSQFGIASHFDYKEKRSGIYGIKLEWFDKLLTKKDGEKDKTWVQRASSIHKDYENETSFMEDVDADFLQERMFIFTPKGEVIDLPRGATVIDFAFAIHSQIGINAEGAYVNGKYSSLKHELKNGDVVEVKAGKKANVTKKWLDLVKTADARTRIRSYLKKNKKL